LRLADVARCPFSLDACPFEFDLRLENLGSGGRPGFDARPCGIESSFRQGNRFGSGFFKFATGDCPMK